MRSILSLSFLSALALLLKEARADCPAFEIYDFSDTPTDFLSPTSQPPVIIYKNLSFDPTWNLTACPQEGADTICPIEDSDCYEDLLCKNPILPYVNPDTAKALLFPFTDSATINTYLAIKPAKQGASFVINSIQARWRSDWVNATRSDNAASYVEIEFDTTASTSGGEGVWYTRMSYPSPSTTTSTATPTEEEPVAPTYVVSQFGGGSNTPAQVDDGLVSVKFSGRRPENSSAKDACASGEFYITMLNVTFLSC